MLLPLTYSDESSSLSVEEEDEEDAREEEREFVRDKSPCTGCWLSTLMLLLLLLLFTLLLRGNSVLEVIDAVLVRDDEHVVGRSLGVLLVLLWLL